MTAVEQETTSAAAYEDRLRILSEASVDQHFDAFEDIAWDDPAYAVDPDDPRWILPEVDTLGGHRWYRSLPQEDQIRIGLMRQANVAKVGLQFEQILVAGLMNYTFALPNRSAEFRYCTHEATEETHHTQMFQEFVNRTGVDAPGGPLLFRVLAPFLPLFARWTPLPFFLGVLAGEEPIDHLQKSILRAGRTMHPLLQRIMQIHVAEEARHIGFAHQYVENHAPRLSRVRRAAVALILPILMRFLCDVIVVPSRKAQAQMGVPRWVVKDLYWRDPASRKMLRDLFADVRMLAENSGLMTRSSRLLWRLLKIDGRAARFRSEPSSAAA
ncbi:diiron oxygenase [Nocardioides sp. CFH 31398]|uniref:AurF N-oxygenase family protein n=1 Tax=Nocardioides sp. CFH 31398 TaxID=2919579 RepID=UPI001F05A8B9|nr:diiron oxygenase [Nocardioides sp. CFH 31398]MCH1867554.1 diiron oxygenase [Nocardioides sp. CFH 31398]